MSRSGVGIGAGVTVGPHQSFARPSSARASHTPSFGNFRVYQRRGGDFAGQDQARQLLERSERFHHGETGMPFFSFSSLVAAGACGRAYDLALALTLALAPALCPRPRPRSRSCSFALSLALCSLPSFSLSLLLVCSLPLLFALYPRPLPRSRSCSSLLPLAHCSCRLYRSHSYALLFCSSAPLLFCSFALLLCFALFFFCCYSFVLYFVQLDPALAQGAGVALEDAFHLARHIQGLNVTASAAGDTVAGAERKEQGPREREEGAGGQLGRALARYEEERLQR